MPPNAPITFKSLDIPMRVMITMECLSGSALRNHMCACTCALHEETSESKFEGDEGKEKTKNKSQNELGPMSFENSYKK
jgi:hypothetical protein